MKAVSLLEYWLDADDIVFFCTISFSSTRKMLIAICHNYAHDYRIFKGKSRCSVLLPLSARGLRLRLFV